LPPIIFIMLQFGRGQARRLIGRIMVAQPESARGSSQSSRPGFKYLVTEMLCWAAGGPQQYTGRDMETSHRHLAITETEWDVFRRFRAQGDVARTASSMLRGKDF
jgi:hypothetical protein